jgi:antitoxin MazE
MNLQINRWGNSLAVRLPAHLVRQLGLHEGSQVSVELTPEGSIKLSPQTPQRPAMTRVELLEQIAQLHKTMPITQPVARDAWNRY